MNSTCCWARVQVRRGSISSELIMCGGGVHSILLLPLVVSRNNRCMHMAHVCCVAAVVKDNSGSLSIGVLKYVCVRGVMDVMCILRKFSMLAVLMLVEDSRDNHMEAALLISSATVIVSTGGIIWFNPFPTVFFTVCSAVTVVLCICAVWVCLVC